MGGAQRPAVSVVVISDYGGRTAEDWNYLRNALDGLARQEFDGGLEVLLVDSTPDGDTMPDDVLGRVRALRIISGRGGTTAAAINTAVAASSAELVALLDGDCTPVSGWLQAGIAAIRAHPDAAAVSGLTAYPPTTFRNRVLATLSRSFLDPGGPGRTHFISSNNAIFRRAVLLDHPLPALRRSLAGRLQAEAIRLAGGQLYFEPAMRVTHRFEGWPMERRIRRSVGYSAVRIRQLNPRIPHAWLLRFGRLSIPLFLALRTAESWWNCVRAGRHYGLRWFELPAAFATAVLVHSFEIGGMMAAFGEARSSGE